MAETNWQSPGGAGMGAGGSTGTGRSGRNLGGAASDTRESAQMFAQSLSNTLKEMDGKVRHLAERNPYAAVGAALGVGFILGGGIPPALVRGLVGFAGRYAMAALLSMVVAEETAKKEVQNEEGR